jgi:hypothetical protein
MPFFCEHHYLELKAMFEHKDHFFRRSSIHLLPPASTFNIYEQNVESKESNALIFDDIYNMVMCIFQVRGTYNISLKKPIRKLKIATSKRLSERYNNLLSIITDETNILEVEMVLIDDIDINKTYKPIKSEFFKKYGGNIAQVYNELVNLTSPELEILLLSGTYKSIALEPCMFTITTTYTPKGMKEGDEVYKELVCNDEKVLLIIDKHYDQELEKKYYYRLVATKIQRCRKAFGLKPWNKIDIYYNGIPHFPLDTDKAQEQIYQITNMALIFADGCGSNCSCITNNERKINEWFNVEELGISLMISLHP